MRDDMEKVITERPRSGARLKDRKGYKKQAKRDLDREESPKRESLIRKWIQGHNDGKRFTDVIGPLKKYLLKQVGRPWDKTFSEIKKVLRGTGMSSQHAIGHIWDFVDLHVEIIDGKPYSKAGRFGGQLISYCPTYVCPKTGILKKNAYYKQRYRYNPIKEPLCVQDRFVVKVKGWWYELLFRKIPKPTSFSYGRPVYPPELRDVYFERTLNWEHDYLTRLYKQPVYCTKVVKLSQRDVSLLNLNNQDFPYPQPVRKHNRGHGKRARTI
jgi:hypothetical protein